MGLTPEQVAKPNATNQDCNETSELLAGHQTWNSVIKQECVRLPGLYLGIHLEGRTHGEHEDRHSWG